MCAKTHAATGDAEERRPRRVDIGWTACCSVIRSFPPLQATGIQPNSDQLCFAASKLPWKALSGTNVMWTFGMTWNTNCAKTTRAAKQPLRVEGVRGVRFPRSYLNMCQPNPVASRRLLIPPSRVGCSYSLQLKNRWIPPPHKKKNLHTNSPSDYGVTHSLGVCAQLFGVLVTSKSVQRACADAREWCRCWRAPGSRPDSGRLSSTFTGGGALTVWLNLDPNRQNEALSLPVALSRASSIMFVWYSSAALRIAPQAPHQWANFSHLCRQRAKVAPTDGSELLGYFVIQMRTFSTSTHKSRNCMLRYERTIRSDVLLNMSTCFPAVLFLPTIS